ncbi:unnamed protein product [Diatraea saccharalis]|uniref:Ricin B lectin domain-containing protein n=1 Tax=Diatraea saccharalis TaxID=40085 RepID=A0A9N9RCU1_9NEOP|nr:unnamed protein product [Diatraea saccharalis]
MCLDTLQRDGVGSPLGVYPCHEKLQATQYFSLSLTGELRDEENCAEVQHVRGSAVNSERRILMMTCAGKQRQKWRYLPSGQLQHITSALCLDAGMETGADALARPYNFSHTFSNSRISRSLLSYTEETPIESNSTIRRHRHKKKHSKKHARKRSHKKRTKNKFILKLVRTLMNDTEDHLEVDIHCKHKQLYPNNSFVRDLVTILNEKNIKVINNGRVFERNKVTELAKGTAPSKVLQKLEIRENAQDQPTERRLAKRRKRKRMRVSLPPITPTEPSTPSEAPVNEIVDDADNTVDFERTNNKEDR